METGYMEESNEGGLRRVIARLESLAEFTRKPDQAVHGANGLTMPLHAVANFLA